MCNPLTLVLLFCLQRGQHQSGSLFVPFPFKAQNSVPSRKRPPGSVHPNGFASWPSALFLKSGLGRSFCGHCAMAVQPRLALGCGSAFSQRRCFPDTCGSITPLEASSLAVCPHGYIQKQEMRCSALLLGLPAPFLAKRKAPRQKEAMCHVGRTAMAAR